MAVRARSTPVPGPITASAPHHSPQDAAGPAAVSPAAQHFSSSPSSHKTHQGRTASADRRSRTVAQNRLTKVKLSTNRREPSRHGSAGAVAGPAAVDVLPATGPDPLTIGRRLRHIRRSQGLTLADAAAVASISPSALSLIENGKREAKLSVLGALAAGLGIGLGELLATAAPSRRAALEIELEKAQRAGSFQALEIPAVRTGPRLPMEALEALVGLHRALAKVQAERAATPEQARRANADLRDRMRKRGNYFGEIESLAAELLTATHYEGGPITRTVVDRMCAYLGFRLVHTNDLPESTRTVTDLG